MINEMQTLSLVEAKDIVEASEEKDKELIGFMKKFIKLNSKEEKKLKEELNSLGIMKMKEEHMVKIIDLLPEDAADINKIFVDVGLEEDETNKILEVVKKYE
jgi:DNA-directed RNA polymerase subunit F